MSSKTVVKLKLKINKHFSSTEETHETNQREKKYAKRVQLKSMSQRNEEMPTQVETHRLTSFLGVSCGTTTFICSSEAGRLLSSAGE